MARALQLRIRLLHPFDDALREAEEDRLLEAEAVGVAHRAAHDPPQHVAAADVRGQDAVADQEGHRPDMIGNHAEGEIPLGIAPVRRFGEFRHPVDDRAEEIGLVIALHPLHDRADPFEPHSRVDAWARQWREPPLCVPVELHEDEVPEFEVAVSPVVKRPLEVGPLIDQDLGAGAARPRLPHRPEVVLLPHPDDPIWHDGAFLLPEPFRLLVLLEDGDPEALLREFEHLGEEDPGVADRLPLEVVSEGEVAEHLEEGVVPSGAPHVLEVVVLPPGAHAFLGAHRAGVRPLLLAEEGLLELHHPRVREEERRVVRRNEGGTRNDPMPPLREEFEEDPPDLRRGSSLHRFCRFLDEKM